MDEEFDVGKIKKNLEDRDLIDKEKKEAKRLAILALVIDSLRKIFSSTDVEVYLVGSIIQPYMFHSESDVDIVVKNFKGDRFDLWTRLEKMIRRNVEVILFEYCHFQDYIIQNGYKVL